MKKFLSMLFFVTMLCVFWGCSSLSETDIAATTLPVWEFTTRLCEGTDLTVTRLVTENVSCLHDYTLQVDQMRAIEEADMVILSGAGLEEFLDDALSSAQHTVDASIGLSLMEGHDYHHGHVHRNDPHIWLSPANAKAMAQTICQALSKQYPLHKALFERNLSILLEELDALQTYGESQLSTLSHRELITFHDGFSYFAESFDLHILQAVEEESGSEASAQTLTGLVTLVRDHRLPAIFKETNGADSAASIIAAETGVNIYTLDMAMAGDSYFESMYHNIDTIREALQ